MCEGLKKGSSKTKSGEYHDDLLMARFLKNDLLSTDPEEGTTEAPVAKKSVEFEIVPAKPENASEMVEYLNTISRETDFTTIDPVNGFWMTVEEEEKFIRDQTADKTAIFLNARVYGIFLVLHPFQDLLFHIIFPL